MYEGTSASLMTKSSSFIYRVLLNLQSMQGSPNFHDGVTIEDLVLYVRKNNLTDGDVFNQIKTALNHAISLGYVQENPENRYRLVVNSAKVQQFPCTSTKRSNEISRVSNIFPTNWLREKTVEKSVSTHSASEKSVKKVQTRSSLKENDKEEEKHKEIQELKSPRRSRSTNSAKNSHQIEKVKKTKRRRKSSCSSSTDSSKLTNRTKRSDKRKHMKTNQNFKQNAKKPKRERRKHCRDVSLSSSLTSTEESYEDIS